MRRACGILLLHVLLDLLAEGLQKLAALSDLTADMKGVALAGALHLRHRAAAFSRWLLLFAFACVR